jgi:hypothetical protein
MGIRTQVPMRRMRKVIPQLLVELFAWLEKEGVPPAGPPASPNIRPEQRAGLPKEVRSLFASLLSRSYLLTASNELQSGKNVPETILAVCPLVALLLGTKYGRLPGGTHAPAGG